MIELWVGVGWKGHYPTCVSDHSFLTCRGATANMDFAVVLFISLGEYIMTVCVGWLRTLPPRVVSLKGKSAAE